MSPPLISAPGVAGPSPWASLAGCPALRLAPLASGRPDRHLITHRIVWISNSLWHLFLLLLSPLGGIDHPVFERQLQGHLHGICGSTRTSQRRQCGQNVV